MPTDNAHVPLSAKKIGHLWDVVTAGIGTMSASPEAYVLRQRARDALGEFSYATRNAARIEAGLRERLARWQAAFMAVATTLDACPDCEQPLELVECPECHGEGGWHNCGEDSCCCLDREEITDICGECRGTGEVVGCASQDCPPGAPTVAYEHEFDTGVCRLTWQGMGDWPDDMRTALRELHLAIVEEDGRRTTAAGESFSDAELLDALEHYAWIVRGARKPDRSLWFTVALDAFGGATLGEGESVRDALSAAFAEVLKLADPGRVAPAEAAP